jgi:hypothetical protein
VEGLWLRKDFESGRLSDGVLDDFERTQQREVGRSLFNRINTVQIRQPVSEIARAAEFLSQSRPDID